MNGMLRTTISHHTGSEMCRKKEIHIGKERQRETHTYNRHTGSLCPLCGKRHTHTLTHRHRKYVGNNEHCSEKQHIMLHTCTLTLNSRIQSASTYIQFINWKFETARKFTFSVYSKCHAHRVSGRHCRLTNEIHMCNVTNHMKAASTIESSNDNYFECL